jgi:hypothetical protein
MNAASVMLPRPLGSSFGFDAHGRHLAFRLQKGQHGDIGRLAGRHGAGDGK